MGVLVRCVQVVARPICNLGFWAEALENYFIEKSLFFSCLHFRIFCCYMSEGLSLVAGSCQNF
jgi:hypothetical protein